MKNYYLILGINSTATGEEIKSAFRRRAKELHPDRSGMESEPFQELQEAYGILSDPESRRRYDQGTDVTVVRRAPRRPSAEPLVRRRRPEPFNPFSASGIEEHTETFRDISLGESFDVFRPSFDELFDRLWSNFEDVARPKSERLESLTVEMVISPEDALRGGQVRVRIPGKAECPTCGGHGAVGSYECWRCEGRGATAVDFPLNVKFPPGIRDGHVAQVSLEEFGIGNFYLTVLFRVSDEAFEER